MNPSISIEETKRRRRERILIPILAVLVGFLTYGEFKVVRLGAGLPFSSTVTTFILINIDMLLVLLLAFLIFRNIVKLFYDRRHRALGAKLRTKLVVAFLGLSLAPTILLFFFSVQFITSSLAFWFNIPVEQTLDNSIRVGKAFYEYVGNNNRFFLERISDKISKEDLVADPEEIDGLKLYIDQQRTNFNLSAIEVYSTNSARLAMALTPAIPADKFMPLPADSIQRQLHKGKFSTLTKATSYGEEMRALGCVPIDAQPNKAVAIVAVTTIISTDLSANMGAISRGFEQYQQLKMLKRPIHVVHMMTLSLVAVLIIFCATWFGFYLAKTITNPIQDLASGIRRVAEGDLNFEIEMASGDEMGTLVNAFNKMTRDLRLGKLQLNRSADELRARNLEIEQRRIYMEAVLRNVSTGVISLDAGGRMATTNKAAENMLGIAGANVFGRHYKRLLSPELLRLAEEWAAMLEHSATRSIHQTVRLTINQSSRTFLVNLTALKDDRDQNIGTVVVFDDVTKAEKAQRMAAWREVARRIAHEVKNPLTPIKLSAQRLQRKYGSLLDGDNGVFVECTKTIIDQVDQIHKLVNEFAAFARWPAASPEPCHLLKIVEETVALYREAHPRITFCIEAQPDMPEQNLDKGQMKRVMVNLIDNAIAAMAGRGSITVLLSHDPILKSSRMEVIDTGPGVPDADKTRLFEPYFSTKKTGMGLGLSIVNAIIEDHHGFIRVQDNTPTGTKFVVELPMQGHAIC